ncbi:sugar transferase [Enterocloster bolteae]|uniref:sugar transferase n=1 Tax=Enterocloster bolteae TaxID=208479 RepID=UPI00237B26AA|nr:sugar transferase [Enterocloster bolteae]
MEKSKLTKQMRWEIAERLAEERLNQVNMLCKKVVPRDGIYTRYVKRLLDIVISIIALVITLPINLLIGIGTYFDVGSPIFFKQERVGKNGKIFSIIKFRNMRNTVDEQGSYCLLCTE